MEKLVNPRILPAEGPFLSWRTDDIIYAYLQAYSTFHPDYKRLYIRKSTLTTIKRQLAIIMFDPSIAQSSLQRTINNHITRLIEQGLLLTTTMKVNRKEEEVYVFPEYDLSSGFRYQILSAETLKKIITVYRPFVVKIFVYLLDRYEWKLSKGETEYVFTKQELAQMMGYAKTTKSALEPITIAIDHLNEVGFLTIQKFSTEEIMPDGKIINVERYKVIAADRSGKSNN